MPTEEEWSDWALTQTSSPDIGDWIQMRGRMLCLAASTHEIVVEEGLVSSVRDTPFGVAIRMEPRKYCRDCFTPAEWRRRILKESATETRSAEVEA